jgi:tetratricopeptide (TPR) repeat protein
LRHAASLLDAERAELLSAFAVEAELTGRLTDSIGARSEAVMLFGSLRNRRAEGRERARLAPPYFRMGENAAAEEASRAAIALLESLPPGRELASAYATRAYLRMLSRDNAEGVRWGRHAAELAERLGDQDTVSFGLNMVGTSYVMAGEIERGVDHLLRSLEVARTAGIELRISSALGMLGSGLGEMYELDLAERYLREQISFAEERDLSGMYSRSWLALVDLYRGRWDDGAERAQTVLAEASDAISRISALIAPGRVRARRGDPGATDVLDQALELSRPGGHLQRLGHVHAARAEAAWLAGDPDGTVAEARAAYSLALEKRHLWFAGELAYWQWKAGALEVRPDWIAEPYRLQLSGDTRGSRLPL